MNTELINSDLRTCCFCLKFLLIVSGYDKVLPHSSFGHCQITNHNKYPTLVEDTDREKGCIYVGVRGIWRNQCTSQFCCDPKTSLKNSLFKNWKKKSWQEQILNKRERKPAFRAKDEPVLWLYTFTASFGPISPHIHMHLRVSPPPPFQTSVEPYLTESHQSFSAEGFGP